MQVDRLPTSSGSTGADPRAAGVRRDTERDGTDRGDRLDDNACSIARALEVIGDRWTILILRDTFKGIRRFGEIRRDLGIPKAVLSDRLSRLVDAGILQRRRYMDHPTRFEYRLTDMGRELSPVLVGLMKWGDRWLSDGVPPTVLVHEPCGHEVDLDFHCDHCGSDFGPTEIAGRPGPGSEPSTDAHDETTR